MYVLVEQSIRVYRTVIELLPILLTQRKRGQVYSFVTWDVARLAAETCEDYVDSSKPRISNEMTLRTYSSRLRSINSGLKRSPVMYSVIGESLFILGLAYVRRT